MADMPASCARLRFVIAAAVIILCISVGWVVFPLVTAPLGVPATFTCHCIGGAIGLIAGILLVRIVVF
jgi:hypothetical protein